MSAARQRGPDGQLLEVIATRDSEDVGEPKRLQPAPFARYEDVSTLP